MQALSALPLPFGGRRGGGLPQLPRLTGVQAVGGCLEPSSRLSCTWVALHRSAVCDEAGRNPASLQQESFSGKF